MSDIKELSIQIDKGLQEKKDFFNSIKYGRGSIKEKLQKKALHKEEERPKTQMQIRSKEEMYNELKDKFRYAWKSPGYCNSAFSNPPVLKGKVLRPLDRERAVMPERSYNVPKDFKGMNVTYHSRAFGDAPQELFPKQYRTYLDGAKRDYLDRVMRPSNYGPLEVDLKIARLPYLEMERGWRTSSMTPGGDFGFDAKASYNVDQNLKSKTSQGTRTKTRIRDL